MYVFKDEEFRKRMLPLYYVNVLRELEFFIILLQNKYFWYRDRSAKPCP